MFLHWFDKTITQQERGLTLVRYADDLVVLGKQIEQAAVERIENFLEKRMGLEINREKTRVVDLTKPKEKIEFLGYAFRCIHSKAKERYCYMTCSKEAEKKA